MSSLFRKEALEHKKDRLFGEVILLQPFSMTVLVTTVVIVCALVLAVLFWGTYARKQTVKGVIAPDKGVVKIYGPQQGNISKVHVKEGEQVIEGQLLVSILAERATETGQDIDTQILKEIETTKEKSQQRIQTEQSIHGKERIKLQSQLEGLRTELEQINDSIETQQRRLDLVKSRVSAAEILKKKNNIAESDYQKTLEEYLAQKQQLQELQRLKTNKETAIQQILADLDELPLKEQARVQELEGNISELTQRSADISGRRQSAIKSPVNGRVTALQASTGQWQSNLPLMSIIPDEAQLQVQLYVPTRAIGFIEVGQPVKIRFDAFPYQRYGIHEGKIESISRNALVPQELPVPLEIKEPVYRVVVGLDQQSVQAYGKQFNLQAGMSLEADIILDKQTLFDWILDPLFSLKGKF